MFHHSLAALPYFLTTHWNNLSIIVEYSTDFHMGGKNVVENKMFQLQILENRLETEKKLMLLNMLNTTKAEIVKVVGIRERSLSTFLLQGNSKYKCSQSVAHIRGLTGK